MVAVDRHGALRGRPPARLGRGQGHLPRPRDTGEVLPTWDEALDAIGADDEPLHVARFGDRFDAQGVLAGSKDANRCIGYLTKYLTKHVSRLSPAETDDQARHADRLADALRYEPCSPTCANWLRYGIQPKNAKPNMRPGACKGKAHRREYLGYAGRRVLVSRKWSGKTLADHRADRKNWLMETLGLPATDPDPLHMGTRQRPATKTTCPPRGDCSTSSPTASAGNTHSTRREDALKAFRPTTFRQPGRRHDGRTRTACTVEAAAERLSTSPRFVRRLIAERRIEFVKVGRHVRISESSLARVHRGGRRRRSPPRDCGTKERSGLMPKKDGHRRFGNVRKLPSGRYQSAIPGAGRRRYDRRRKPSSAKTDADRALMLIEAQIATGEWTDPERGKVELGRLRRCLDQQRPGLRARTVELYNWLLAKHITPYLGGVRIGKLSTPMIRRWRAGLLAKGVSVSMAAKAYRLLRAIMTTAVEEDKILPRNPCRMRGAGEEHAAERPVLTVAQVFDLAERVGRRPVGNVRKLPAGGYRLRFRRDGKMLTAPEVYGTRSAAENALWAMADNDRADFTQDGRLRAMVLLATFASLRWGEVTALTRSDIDLKAGTVRIRAAFTQRRSKGSAIVLGPPKSRAGQRVVGIPKSIIPAIQRHMAKFVGPEPGALVFFGQRAAPLRRSNFGKMSGWPYTVRNGRPAEGLHFHDLRHTGNTFAATGGRGSRS